MDEGQPEIEPTWVLGLGGARLEGHERALELEFVGMWNGHITIVYIHYHPVWTKLFVQRL